MSKPVDKLPESKDCYICAEDLAKYYKEDKTQQNDLNAMPQKFPEITKWNGEKREVCPSCYKAAVECMEVYNERKQSEISK